MVRSDRAIIAITGSAGKTTTKEMTASILGRHWKVLKTPNNWNLHNHNRDLLNTKLTPDHRAVVLEFGMSKRGHIRKHCQVIVPNMAVVTNVGTAHIGNFGGNVKQLAREKSELIKYMKPDGILFLNGDDKNTRLMPMHNFKGKIIRVGINNPHVDYHAYDIQYIKGGMRFKCSLRGREHSFSIPIYGTHNVYNALFAIAIADSFKLDASIIKAGLRDFFRNGQRMIVYKLGKEIRIIDDTYSANLNASKAAIEVLNNIGGQNNIAVLGSMKCMGRYSKTAHKKAGEFLADKNIHSLMTYGEDARWILKGAVEAGFAPERAKHFTDSELLSRSLLNEIKPGTTILVKGSHEMEMHKIVSSVRSAKKLKGAKGKYVIADS